MFDTTFLSGLGETPAGRNSLDWLRPGARLPLRRVSPTTPRPAPGTPRREVEVQAPDGRALGYLPPDEGQAVAELLDAGLQATACVTALVPVLHRPRVHLSIQVAGAVAADGGA